MGIPTVTMARIYQGQLNKMPGERNQLTFEKFPFVGFSKVSGDGTEDPRSTR